jgi:hypothetical protein
MADGRDEGAKNMNNEPAHYSSLPASAASLSKGKSLAWIGVVLIALSIVFSVVGAARIKASKTEFQSSLKSVVFTASPNKELLHGEIARTVSGMRRGQVLTISAWAMASIGLTAVAIAVLRQNYFEPWLYWITLAEAMFIIPLCGWHTIIGLLLILVTSLRESKFTERRNA